jgi:hypothetical protein
MARVIGIDFDNTIVTYDRIFYEAALERGLIAAGVEPTKRAVRDAVRRGADGDTAWQRLQGRVYGPLMSRALMMPGLGDFLVRSRRAGHHIVIVSHKTEAGHYDETRTNLRAAALEWMKTERFFEPAGFALQPGDVFFEGTRQDKVRRIMALGCSDFIDDLEEVFAEPAFPPATAKVLFAPGVEEVERAGAIVKRSWQEISEHYFGHA